MAIFNIQIIIFILILGSFLIIKADIQNVNRICSCSEPQCLEHCQRPNKRVIREVSLDSDEDATGGAIEQNNNNFEMEGTKDEESSPDTMMIYDDDSPALKEDEEIKSTTKNNQQTSTIKSLIDIASTIKSEATTKVVKNISKNFTTKTEKTPKILEETKKLAVNSDKNETEGINNNFEKVAESGKNKEIKSKSHRHNCNSDLLRRIILEVFNDNNIGSRPSIAKRKIQSKATEQLGGRIDVICSRKAFSYVVNSEIFCEVEKADIVCLCYKQQV